MEYGKHPGKRFAVLALWLAAALPLPAGILVSTAAAQNAPKIGRLHDGRAYRTDGNGFRLVDDMAELEVTADDLRRQVEALENQLIEKEKVLQRMEQGRSASSPGVKEKNIIGSAPKPSVTEPPNCNELVSNLYRRVAQLEHEAAGRNSAAALAPCSYESAENRWKQEAERLSRLVTEMQKHAVGDDFSANRTRDLEQQLAGANARLSEREVRMNELQSDLQRAAVHAQDLEQQLAQLHSRGQGGQTPAKSESEKRGALAAAPPAEAPVPALAEAPKQAPGSEELKSRRKELSAVLSRIQHALLQRKDLLDQAKARRSAIAIQVQAPVSRSGASLDQLRQEVGSLNAGTDAARLSEGLHDIERLVNDDIAVLKRLSKI